MTAPYGHGWDDTDWDPAAADDYDPYEDPDYDEEKDPWVWRPVVTVELPPVDDDQVVRYSGGES